MKITAKNAKRLETYEWLMGKGRSGEPRVRTLGWNRLARIYRANRPGSQIRKAITNEARRCGYTPTTILALHG